MTAFLAYISANWVSIAAAIGALGHIFPAKTIVNRLGSAVAQTPDVQSAILTGVAAGLQAVSPKSPL